MRSLTSPVYLLALSATLALPAAPLAAQSQHHGVVGVIVDRGRANPDPLLARTPYAHVFSPETMQITASVQLPLPPFTAVFDVEIAPDLGEAYVGNSDANEIWVVDLRTNPPSLASGINPIPLNPNGGAEDLCLTPDGRYLLVASNNWLGETPPGSGLSVVDTRTRTEVSFRPFNPSSPTAVEVAPDGSVLVVELVSSAPSSGSSNVHRFRLDHGNLVATGDVAVNTVPAVQNLLVPHYPQLPQFLDAVLSRHTVCVSRPGYGSMDSLRTHGMAPVDSVALPNPTGIDLCFDPFCSILYVRSNELGVSGGAGVGNSRIDGYLFSPITGHFGPQVMSATMDRRAGTAFGVEQTAIDPVTRRLFASGLANGEVRVFDSLSGAQVGTITDPSFVWGLGIAIRRR